MWFCKPHILLITILVINVAKWKDENISPMMVNAITSASLMPNDFAMYGENMSKGRKLWSADGIKSLSKRDQEGGLGACIASCVVDTCA